MIQRVQSVLLILVAILGIVASFIPIMQLAGYEMEVVVNAYKTLDTSDTSIVVAKNMGVGVMQGLVILVSLVIVALYKNRGLQIKLAKLNILLIAFQVAAIVMYVDAIKLMLGPNAEEIVVSLQFGAVIPVLSLILTYLAIRFIKKDEKLVRSADRLR